MNDDLVERVARAMYEDHVRRQPTHLAFPDAWFKWEDLDNADRTYRENYRFEAAAAIRVVREEAATLIEKYNIAHGGDEPQLVLRKDGDLFGLAYAAALRALGEKP